MTTIPLRRTWINYFLHFGFVQNINNFFCWKKQKPLFHKSLVVALLGPFEMKYCQFSNEFIQSVLLVELNLMQHVPQLWKIAAKRLFRFDNINSGFTFKNNEAKLAP